MSGHSTYMQFWRRAAAAAMILASVLATTDGLLGLYLHTVHARANPPRRMFAGMDNLQQHPEYIWAYIPGSRAIMSGEGLTLDAHINQDGLRDEPGRPTGRYFLALGDSFTFGWLVKLQDTWHKQLAKYLSEDQDQPIASVNLGMWMSTFSQHYLRLREMLDRYPRPEFVVHLVYPSHVQTIAAHALDYDATGDPVRARSLLLHIKDRGMYYGADKDSLLDREVSWPYSLWLLRRRTSLKKFTDLYARTVGVIERLDDLNLYSGDHADVFTTAWEMTERSLGATARLLRRNGIPYIVAIVPRDLQVARPEWNNRPVDRRIFESTRPQDKFLAICRANGILCVNLLPHFRVAASSPDRLYFLTDPHWTPAGHEVAGRTLAHFIENRLFSRVQ